MSLNGVTDHIRAQLDARDKRLHPAASLVTVTYGQVWYVSNCSEAYEAVVTDFKGDRVEIRHRDYPRATPTLALRSMFTNLPGGYTLVKDS